MGDYRIHYSTKGDEVFVLRLVHRTRAYRPETINALMRCIASLEKRDG